MLPILIILVLQALLIGISASFAHSMYRIVKANGRATPYVPTRPRYFVTIARALDIRDGDVVYDLGSGDGRFLIYCARHYPQATFVGIERGRVLFLQARLRYLLAGTPPNLIFRCADIATSDFRDATRIYAYLFPRILGDLFAAPPPRVRVVTRAFQISHVIPSTSIELTKHSGLHNQHLLYVYQF